MSQGGIVTCIKCVPRKKKKTIHARHAYFTGAVRRCEGKVATDSLLFLCEVFKVCRSSSIFRPLERAVPPLSLSLLWSGGGRERRGEQRWVVIRNITVISGLSVNLFFFFDTRTLHRERNYPAAPLIAFFLPLPDKRPINTVGT